MSRMSELHAVRDQMPDDIDHAIAVCERNGILCRKPETRDEQLDREWQALVATADRIVTLVENGAHLPPREKSWMIPMAILRIEQATNAAKISVQ